jgi:hypothetical protein
MCECANPDCVEMTELSVAEYEVDPKLAHSLPGQDGHVYLEFERVL